MKKSLLFFCFLLSFSMIYGQEVVQKQLTRKLLLPSDSFRSLNRERQKSIAANLEAAGRGKERNKKVLLFTGGNKTEKEKEISFIGRLENKEVYRVDLSMVVSKYIGETEKNLDLLFAKAEDKQWILFFDEADDLFGRGELTDSTLSYIQRQSKEKKVTTVFYCKDDCSKRFKKTGYVRVKE